MLPANVPAAGNVALDGVSVATVVPPFASVSAVPPLFVPKVAATNWPPVDVTMPLNDADVPASAPVIVSPAFATYRASATASVHAGSAAIVTVTAPETAVAVTPAPTKLSEVASGVSDAPSSITSTEKTPTPGTPPVLASSTKSSDVVVPTIVASPATYRSPVMTPLSPDDPPDWPLPIYNGGSGCVLRSGLATVGILHFICDWCIATVP